MMCGAATGQTYWALFYPIDFIKTQLQTLPTGVRKGIFRLSREIYREHGMSRFYRGVHVNAMRSLPASSVGMGVYESTKSYL